MRNRRLEKYLVLAGVVAIAALAGFLMFTSYQQTAETSRNSEFLRSYEDIVVQTNSLTADYQAEEGKWAARQYDNETMIGIVEKYLPRYQGLIDRANNINPPERYKSAVEYLVKSLDYEKQSNEYFKAYLITGNQEEYNKSSELLTLSLSYSTQADASIKAAGG